ncbi:MAG: DUF4252 domain-containing protein [Lewinellaceae bacterium]|nr:DUF4252 domain-containing protein [Saprospiraceae bacterium]MCB9344150.1 DUF4252 domain-containing protein [Lewinellaceae bacterium]
MTKKTMMTTTNSHHRSIFTGLFLALSLLVCNSLQAQDSGLYWKYKDYDGAIAVSIPGYIAKSGSLFIHEKGGKKLIRKVKRVRVLVFPDGQAPFTDKDFRRFNRKARRHNLDELITVRSGKTRVNVYGKMRKNTIRKIVVFFNEPGDAAGMVSLKGKFNLKDLDDSIRKMEQKSKDGKKPVIPDSVKIPVSRV